MHCKSFPWLTHTAKNGLLHASFLAGTSWGEAGYIRIVRGRNSCGISNMASYQVDGSVPPAPPTAKTIFLRARVGRANSSPMFKACVESRLCVTWLCFPKISITLVTRNLVEKIAFSLFVGIDSDTRLSVAGWVSIGIHDFPPLSHYSSTCDDIAY